MNNYTKIFRYIYKFIPSKIKESIRNIYNIPKRWKAIFCKHTNIIQCAARITRHRVISLSPRGRPARRFDLQMGSDFESLGINFEARAVILGSWTLIFRISEMDVCCYRNSAFAEPPQGTQ